MYSKAPGRRQVTIDGGEGENNIQAQLFISDIDRRGDATLDINGGSEADNVLVQAGIDSEVTINTGDGDDTVDLVAGPGLGLLGDGSRPLLTIRIEPDVDANFEVNTGSGNDEVTLETIPIGGEVTGRLVNSTTGDGNDVVQTSTGDDSFSLGSGADQAESGDGADDVRGGSGNDLIKSEGGNDNASGDEGNDQISGGGGNDRLFRRSWQ